MRVQFEWVTSGIVLSDGVEISNTQKASLGKIILPLLVPSPV